MLVAEIIRAKRDRGRLDREAIEAMVAAIADGRASEGQMGAFAMAVVLNGMDRAECTALTLAMARSGRTLEWRGEDRAGPVLDKHSTGGVGDKVSLVLAPLLAACGATVPMVSGRGLGHTGGTLDKLDAIPGYDTSPSLARLRRAVREAGCAIVGAGPDLAPADRRLYAVRDVTATVESEPLIVASILSKKLAAGLEGLVLDVKAGSGAFAAEPEAARSLARALVEVARAAGLPARALVTDMGRVLGRAAGNALEVAEAIEFLTAGRRDPRLETLVFALGAEALVLGGLAASPGDAAARLRTAFDSGSAAERFARMVAALGGPADLLERPDAYLPRAPVVVPVPAPRAGRVVRADVRALGLAVVALGGGRARPDDAVDPRAGLEAVAGPGDEVGPGRPIAVVHAPDEGAAAAAARAVARAVEIGDLAPGGGEGPVVRERVG